MSSKEELIKKDKLLKKTEIIMIVLIIILLVLLITYLLIPKIKFKDEIVEITYNTNYIDKDYNAKNIFKDYTNNITKEDNININKIGTYNIKYKLKYGFIKITKTKIVKVIDNIKPEIKLNGDNNIIICPNKNYEEEGYVATDEYDGDLTDKVKIEKKDNEIIYKVKDNSQNEIIIKRNISKKDIELPKIELKGNKIYYLYKGNTYNEPGYIANDNCDGDITDKVTIEGQVNNNKIGTYTLIYNIEDTTGNKNSEKREIKVIDNNNVASNNGCIIYLTFDDGPSNITDNILNTLSRENVKATFFVTGNVDSYPGMLKREYQEGHSIALHTYSHNYSYLYSNKNNFFNDLDKVNNSIERIIGIRSNIIRFPGGSSNTVSKKYYEGIMTYLTNEVVNRGYSYFDWNVDSNDAGSSINNKNQIYNNVINNINYSDSNIVLMHDSSSHQETANALSNIIESGKSKGCLFKKIDNTTPTIRHRVNN